MITLNYDITTGLAKFAATTVIKRFGDVPCRLVFSAAPGAVSDIQLSLGSDADAPAILAYTDTWTQESDLVWTAQLDVTDARLADYMDGKQSVAVDLELIVTIDGEAQYSPNLSLTVQQPIVTGPTTSDGGPTYYTQAQVDAAIADMVTRAGAQTLSGAKTFTGTMLATGKLQHWPDTMAVGDSISIAAHTYATGWLEQLAALPPFGSAARNYSAVAGRAISGTGGMNDVYATEARPHMPVVTGRPVLAGVMGGNNDIHALSRTASQVEADLTTLWALIRADGGKVLAMTILPSTGFSGGEETVRTTVNTWIAAQSALWDVFYDAAAALPTPSNTTLYVDGTHPTSAGHAILAAGIAGAVLASHAIDVPQLPDTAGYSTAQMLPRAKYLTGANYPLAMIGVTDHEFIWSDGNDNDNSSGGSSGSGGSEYGVMRIQSSATNGNFGARSKPIGLWVGVPGRDGYNDLPRDRPVAMISRFRANAPLPTDGQFFQVAGKNSGSGMLNVGGFGWGLTYNAANIANVVGYAYDNTGPGLTSTVVGTIDLSTTALHEVALFTDGLGNMSIFIDRVYAGLATGISVPNSIGGYLVSEALAGSDNNVDISVATTRFIVGP